MITKLLTEQITFAGLRQQAERLEIPGFARMRKQELIKAISEAQKPCTKEPNTTVF
ncbi:Rho termination factor N-terminal domain-containing protein [Allocoleopsis sp.]|uniref:Rho termination factor N-terminal domain-containing protein n=1 Tax=Allocoleopsis sp. TaxID=3088169 RepID=UPI002FD77A2B